MDVCRCSKWDWDLSVCQGCYVSACPAAECMDGGTSQDAGAPTFPPQQSTPHSQPSLSFTLSPLLQNVMTEPAKMRVLGQSIHPGGGHEADVARAAAIINHAGGCWQGPFNRWLGTCVCGCVSGGVGEWWWFRVAAVINHAGSGWPAGRLCRATSLWWLPHSAS